MAEHEDHPSSGTAASARRRPGPAGRIGQARGHSSAGSRPGGRPRSPRMRMPALRSAPATRRPFALVVVPRTATVPRARALAEPLGDRLGLGARRSSPPGRGSRRVRDEIRLSADASVTRSTRAWSMCRLPRAGADHPRDPQTAGRPATGAARGRAAPDDHGAARYHALVAAGPRRRGPGASARCAAVRAQGWPPRVVDVALLGDVGDSAKTKGRRRRRWPPRPTRVSASSKSAASCRISTIPSSSVSPSAPGPNGSARCP